MQLSLLRTGLQPRSLSCRHRRPARLQVIRSSAADSPVVGIDLGTTNSAIAVVESGVPRIIPTTDGRTTPSVVSFGADGEVIVGRAAKRVAAKEPQNTFYSTKRLIGRKLKAVRRDSPKLAYGVDGDAGGRAVLQCSRSPTGSLGPEEVAAHLLRYLLAAAEAELGAPIGRAAISVPAYFDSAQREATVAAGKAAGLTHVRLIREPVAAALAFGLDLRREATVLVADLGGGTFDVALLEVGNGTVEVLATGGDAQLGGDDWDSAISRFITDKHLRPAGVGIRSPQMRARLRAVAESAKVTLSDAAQVVLRLPLADPPLEVLLTQRQLDSLAAPLFKRALVPLEDACQQAGVDLQAALAKAEAARARGGSSGGRRPTRRERSSLPLDVQIRPKRRPPISEVLLVGGATRMPSFRRFITNATGLTPRESAVDPDESVAVGAAIQAAMLSGDLDDFMVMDVWQAALMRAFAGQTPEVEAAIAARDAREELAAELGVHPDDVSMEDFAEGGELFKELTEAEIEALLAEESESDEDPDSYE